MSEAISSGRDPSGSVWRAFREPEAFALDWHRSGRINPLTFLLLAAVAVLGTAAYGALFAVPNPPATILECSLLFTAAAAISWAAPLPAVYILNSLAGSRLRVSTTLLSALLTAAWGGLGFLAFLPITALVLFSVPSRWAILATHLAVFGIVGIGMAVLYGGLQAGLEPDRGSGRSWWLWLFVLLQVELLYLFGVFRFATGS